jgi:hypothetical protein
MIKYNPCDPLYMTEAQIAAAIRKADTHLLCQDCGLHTLDAGHFYMVSDDLWFAATGRTDGILCLNCLEIRLARQLTLDDFPLWDDDRLWFWPKGERMQPECWGTDWRREQMHGLIRDPRQLDLFIHATEPAFTAYRGMSP